ncbi:MAG: hypothetical protein ABR929_08830 [Roseiarcus sp.]|jgi:hypothetical protein
MPWAVWFVATLVVSMWIPIVGYWVAYFTMIFTFLATYSLPAILAQTFSGRASEMAGVIEIVHIGGPALTDWEYLWGLFGWTGVAWLAAVAILGAWIAIRTRAGRSVRGLMNLLILVIGWPICFWLAMHVVSTTASG